MFCKKIDIDIFPFKTTNWLERTHNEYYHVLKNPNQEVSVELQKYLFKKNLFIDHASFFYLAPYETGGIHIDGNLCDSIKLNFIFGGQGSVMNWYKTDVKKEIHNAYAPYSPDEVTLIHSEELSGTTIVQVGVPHNVTNAAEPRYCFSIFMRRITGGWPTMKEAVSIDWSK